MIGWYVHHRGSGHLHRAQAVRRALTTHMTVLSSLPRPEDWDGAWIHLERDDAGPVRRPDAGGRLHWAPVHDDGLSARMNQISTWIHSARPDLIVCDVSVEVSLLARLHGVPVVVVAMPGDRRDEAHRLGYDIADAVIGCWPPQADGLFRSTAAIQDKLRLVGGLARFSVVDVGVRRPGKPRVSVLLGTGGSDITTAMIDKTRTQCPDWEWTVMGRHVDSWSIDPFEALCDADVVITQAGQNAIAEVAAARTPALVIPAERPYAEQTATARALRTGPWPVTVVDDWPKHGWPLLLRRTADLDGAAWASWSDGDAATRLATIIEELIPARALSAL